ncbi:MAG: glycosyltransferase family 2 protein [Methanobacterium sp.]|nr:glycosyltransferase family 2 protein [Methanobacterium sp.]
MKISLVIPMYNEEENVAKTLEEVTNVLKKFDDFEIIVVDDGSTDNTYQLTYELISSDSRIKLLKHPVNMGMGRALRTGFEKAEGDVIITIDADLSYDPSFIPKLIDELDEPTDIVIGSQYMEGGKTENIPALRLFISKSANKIVGYAMADSISTVTGVLRAYRKEVLDSVELESNGTEINPEIISKARAVGFNIKEIPVTLKGRELGESKVRFRSTTISHLLFTFFEKPMILFGTIGLIICLIGVISAIYLFYEYLIGTLDPTRPLMLFMVLMILSGIQILIFGFVATQISLLKREIYVVQKENKLLRKKLK